MAERGTCSVCGASVMWRRTGTGAVHEMDPEPHPQGSWALLADGTIRYRADLPDHSGPFVRSHYASCVGRPAPSAEYQERERARKAAGR